MFTLGGTVAMGPTSKGLSPALDASAILAAVPGLGDVADVRSIDFRNVPSAHLSLSDIIELAGAIMSQPASDNVVVVQGTDTMEETAFALDVLVGSERVIVVTGAMRAPSQIAPDGPANLLAAVRLAASLKHGGAFVVMNEEVHHAWRVEKTAVCGASAFASPGFGPVGRVVEGCTDVQFDFKRPEIALQRIPAVPRPVALIAAAMGHEGWHLRAIAAAGFEGAVVAAIGAGHVPPSWIEPIEELAAAMPVVLASRIATGPVHRHTYGFAGSELDLIACGLLPSGYLSPAKARVLLSLALGAGMAGDALRALFARASMH